MKLAQTGKVMRGEGAVSGENIAVCETQLSTGYCTIYLHSGLVYYLHWTICWVALIAFYVPHKLHEHKQHYHIRQSIMWNVLSFFVRSLMRSLFCLVLFHFFSLPECSLLDPKWLFIWYNCMCHCGDFCTTNDDSDETTSAFSATILDVLCFVVGGDGGGIIASPNSKNVQSADRQVFHVSWLN